MRHFYILSHDIRRNDLEVVSDYELGNFDLTRFWNGEEFRGKIPSDVRLWVSKGTSSDYLGNPLSWQIVSDRLWSHMSKLVEQNCQLVEIPLYAEGSNSRVARFSLLNVTCSISAVRSDAAQPELSIDSLELDERRIPSDVHIFRLAESSTQILVSDALRQQLTGKELQGIALIRVKMTQS